MSSIQVRASYLRDAVFAADDGIITTFAVVMGATGASLDSSVVIVLGFANLLADGFSMATGIYMGSKSEKEYEKSKNDAHWKEDDPWGQSIITFFSFILFGFIPLIPFVFGLQASFFVSSVLVALALFLVGILKGIYTKKNTIKSGIEVLLIGGIAALIAYFVGRIVDKYVI